MQVLRFLHNSAIILSLLGVSASCLVVALAYRWTREEVLRSFLFLLASFAGIAVSVLVPVRFSIAGIAAGTILEVAAELVYLVAMPRFVAGALGLSPSRAVRLGFWSSYAFLAAYYIRAAFWGIGRVGAVTALSFVLTIAAVTFMILRLGRVEDRLLRGLFRRFLLTTAVFIPLTILDSIGSIRGWRWIAPFDRLSVAFYVLSVSILIIAEASRWLAHIAERKLRGASDAAAGGAAPETDTSPAGDGAAVGALGADLDFDAFGFSPRQGQIARLILRGYSAKEIGAKLGISAKTAENHTYALYRKVGAQSRLQFYSIVRRVPRGNATGRATPPAPPPT